MQEYKVYECEEKTTQSGKTLKKLVLQREGAQWPIKNVTMWDDHPEYKDTQAGGILTCDLIEKDSDTINPNSGKPYINRTVAKPGQVSPQQQIQQLDSGKIDRMFYMIGEIYKHVVPKDEKPESVQKAEEAGEALTEADVPFWCLTPSYPQPLERGAFGIWYNAGNGI